MKSIRSFVIDAITEQFETGNSNITIEPIIATVLADESLTNAAVTYAVKTVANGMASKVIRQRLVHGDGDSNLNAAGVRLINAVTSYGLSLLDIHFGLKCLGDYLPTEAVAYASQQHGAARKMAIQARFVAAVAKACRDDMKPIREQVTNEQVEAIRKATIETSPNSDAAEIALAVA